ncbi:Uncharacterised protein [Sporosarcina pasteurii]|uniref:Uncharacterized protein n=1 Tax=Sporosarcina pasteurii TaxID=1474 RepID=A0A380BAK3_SPOPA|nr:Uncharacterised protein [Sporosarcina pasteurii]
MKSNVLRMNLWMNRYTSSWRQNIFRAAGTVTHSYIETPVRDKTDLLRGLSHLPNIHALAFVNNVDQFG